MTFASHIIRQPRPFDASAGAGISDRFHDLDAVGLLSAVAACSPYLMGLMLREEAFLRDGLTMQPDAALDAQFAALEGLTTEVLGSGLRQIKRRVALWTALCDLGGVWPLETVTGALTRLADRAVHLALITQVGEEIRRGKLPGATPDDAATAGGMVALAMGKMGAGELNYSSDIDLICLFDEARYRGAEQEARASFIKVARRMTAILSDATDGYVFRTDLRLRPDAAVTPVCLSMAAAES